MSAFQVRFADRRSEISLAAFAALIVVLGLVPMAIGTGSVVPGPRGQ